MTSSTVAQLQWQKQRVLSFSLHFPDCSGQWGCLRGARGCTCTPWERWCTRCQPAFPGGRARQTVGAFPESAGQGVRQEKQPPHGWFRRPRSANGVPRSASDALLPVAGQQDRPPWGDLPPIWQDQPWGDPPWACRIGHRGTPSPPVADCPVKSHQSPMVPG